MQLILVVSLTALGALDVRLSCRRCSGGCTDARILLPGCNRPLPATLPQLIDHEGVFSRWAVALGLLLLLSAWLVYTSWQDMQ
jgi:hypothetical protein